MLLRVDKRVRTSCPSVADDHDVEGALLGFVRLPLALPGLTRLLPASFFPGHRGHTRETADSFRVWSWGGGLLRVCAVDDIWER